MSVKIYNQLTEENLKELAEILKKDGTGVLPSDTIYGIFASSFSKKGIEKLYQFRGRDKSKPIIVHISNIDQIKDFSIQIDPKTKAFLEKIWPNKISVILPCDNQELAYLHRGTNSLSFRLIDHPILTQILEQAGPLSGASANIEEQKPSETIEEAQNYFSNLVDFYFDYGKISGPPSTVIKIKDGQIEVIRQGSFNIDQTSI